MKKTGLLLIVALLAFSCNVVFMASNVRKLEIGMSKNQVVRIMGGDYSVVYADSSETILGYVNPDTNSGERYLLSFEDGRLVTIETLFDPRPIHRPHP